MTKNSDIVLEKVLKHLKMQCGFKKCYFERNRPTIYEETVVIIADEAICAKIEKKLSKRVKMTLSHLHGHYGLAKAFQGCKTLSFSLEDLPCVYETLLAAQ